MDIMTDYKDNVLTITDAEVAADWRLGLLRAVGVAGRYRFTMTEAVGRWGAKLPGSMGEHLDGGYSDINDDNGFQKRLAPCAVAEIYNVQEESGSRYDFDSFGGTDTEVTLIKANVTCACGHIDRKAASFEIPIGDFIMEVMREA